MRERVEDLVGRRARIMWVSTFHSACVRILRKEIDKFGYKSSFSIYDAADSKRLMTLVLRDLDLDPKRYQPRAVLNWVSTQKNELVDEEKATANAQNHLEETYAEAYTIYQRRLREANALDFDDLIMTTVHLLQAFPEVRETYRRRFRHVLVDEYQDTNHAQYALVRELCADEPGAETGGTDRVEPSELMVVGDADQSIYAFRGANIRNILQFEEDFPNARSILLEQNYRSTQTILNAANSVISRNKGRKPKNLWSDAGDGDKITGYVADDEHDEARFVSEEIDKLTDAAKAKPGDVAVFYRTNAQSRVFEEVFIRVGMPYKVVGGVRFYERKEVRDALAYLRMLVNPADEISLRRILNVPKRASVTGPRPASRRSPSANGSPSGTRCAARRRRRASPAARSTASGRSWTWSTSSSRWSTRGAGGRRPRAGARPQRLPQGARGLRRPAGRDPRGEPRRARRGGPRVRRRARVGPLGRPGRHRRPAAGARRLPGTGRAGGRLDQIPDQPEGGDDNGVVTLMTLHTAKGLEFPVVFLTGLEDGVFPHMRSLGDQTELEEERRLAYVGLTRARERLYVSRAVVRSAWGAPAHNPASRFVDELPVDLVDWRRTEAAQTSWNRPVMPSLPQRNAGGVTRRFGTAAIRADSAAKAKGTREIPSLDPGDRVLHDSFGMGTVVSLDGAGDNAVASIDFGSEGVKRLLLRYAPVEKL